MKTATAAPAATPQQTFGDWIRERRLAAGYATQADLAAAMSAHAGEDERVVPDNYVWQLEAGRVRVPGQPRRRQLAAALYVAEDDILRAAGLLEPEDETARDPEAPLRPGERAILTLLRPLSERDLAIMRGVVAGMLDLKERHGED